MSRQRKGYMVIRELISMNNELDIILKEINRLSDLCPEYCFQITMSNDSKDVSIGEMIGKSILEQYEPIFPVIVGKEKLRGIIMP